MPGGNRKGPEGEGPKTGRGLGLCAGNDKPGDQNVSMPSDQKGKPIYGAGRGGMSVRRGFGHQDESFENESGADGGRGMGRFGFGRGRGRGRGRGLGRGQRGGIE